MYAFVHINRTIDRIIGVDCKTVTEIILGEGTIGRCKIIEVRAMQVDAGTVIEMIIETTIEIITETIIEMTTEITLGMTIEMIILQYIEVGLEKKDPQVSIEGMTEAVEDQY